MDVSLNIKLYPDELCKWSQYIWNGDLLGIINKAASSFMLPLIIVYIWLEQDHIKCYIDFKLTDVM